MESRIAFTAQFWGEHSAVVCRAFQNRPGPVVDPQFGHFATWTEAQSFAAALNAGLNLDPVEARLIVTSAFLKAAPILWAAQHRIPTSANSSAIRGAQMAAKRFVLFALCSALTLCRTVPFCNRHTQSRCLLQVRLALAHAQQFLASWQGEPDEIREIAALTQIVTVDLQRLAPPTRPDRAPFAPRLATVSRFCSERESNS